MNPKASPFTFLGILIVFILPFLEFSCQGQKIASLNGYQVAFGTELDMKSPIDGSVEKHKVGATPLVAFALILTLVAAGIAFKNGKRAAIPAGLAALLLLLSQSAIEKDTLENGRGMITASFEIGFYLSLIVIVGGAVLGIIAANGRKASPQHVIDPPATGPGSGPPA